MTLSADDIRDEKVRVSTQVIPELILRGLNEHFIMMHLLRQCNSLESAIGTLLQIPEMLT